MKTVKRFWWPMLVLFLLVGALAHAQGASSIFGRVSDSSGGVLPGVTVTLSSPALLEPRVAVTSGTGTYEFPGLRLGLYTVRFELDSFATVVTEGLQLASDFNAQANAELVLSTLQEEVVVSAATPIIDIRSTVQGERFNTEELKLIPSTRDIYHVVNQTPGILVDRQNVGGNLNGQQTGVFSRGQASGQGRWHVEGVDVGGGAGGAFTLDFNSAQEVQISTGGADVTRQTPGVLVNMLTKSGSDAFSGMAWTYHGGGPIGNTNATDELRLAGNLNNPLAKTLDFGGQVGGPIVEGRAWFWGTGGRQRAYEGILAGGGSGGFFKDSLGGGAVTAKCAPVAANQLAHSFGEVVDCLETNKKDVPTLGFKITARPVTGNLLTVHSAWTMRVEKLRDTNALIPPSATSSLGILHGGQDGDGLGALFPGLPGWNHPLWNTELWPPTWKFGDQHIITDRWLVEGFLGHHCFCYTIAGDPTLQPMRENVTGHLLRSTSTTFVEFRANNMAELSSTYFLPEQLGGDHSFKFGYRYKWERASFDGFGIPSETRANFDSAAGLPRFSTAFSARLGTQKRETGLFNNHSAWLQDTYSRGRVTLNLGFRWDRQADSVPAITVPGHPFQGGVDMNGAVFGFLPPLNAVRQDSGVVWNTYAPRLSVTYDLTGDATNVIKASYALYYDQRRARTNQQLSRVLDPTAGRNIIFPWTDLNADQTVQLNELDTSTILSFGGFDPAQPSLSTTTNTVDPNTDAPKTDEVVIGFGKEFEGGVGFDANYIWRRYTKFIWSDRAGITSADWSPVTFTPAAGACPSGVNARCDAVTYFVPNFPLPAASVQTNRPDHRRIYHGVELVARKRFLGGWMVNGSFAFNSTVEHFDSAAAFDDPTNISLLDGNQFAPTGGIGGGGGSPTRGIPVNAKWIVRGNGSYRVPRYDINLALAVDVRQGFPLTQGIRIASRPNAAGSVVVLLDAPGDVRYQTFRNVDFHVDKEFRTAAGVTIGAVLDIFNIFNVDTVLGRRTNQNASNANGVFATHQARIARAGVTVSF